jgi:hypothetical protein
MFSGGYVLAGLLWIFWQTMGHTALDWSYFAYPLVFPLVGAITANFAFWTSLRKPLNLACKLIICAILVGFPAYFQSGLYQLEFLPRNQFVEVTIFGLVYGIVVALLVPRFLRVWGGIVALSVCIAFSMLVPSAYAPSQCPLARLVERAVDHGHRFVRAEKVANGFSFDQIFMWADKRENISVPRCPGEVIPLEYFERSLASTGFTYLEPPWGTPSIEAISSKRLTDIASANGVIVFVTDRAEQVDRLMQRFEEAGGSLTAKEFHVIETGNLRIPLYHFVVRKDTSH